MKLTTLLFVLAFPAAAAPRAFEAALPRDSARSAASGSPVGGSLVKVTPAQVRSFLDRFQVRRVDIRAADLKTLKDDPAVKGIISQVLASAAKAAGDKRDEMDPDLPELFPHGPQLAKEQHLIFYDTHDAHFLERWKKQTELLRAQLLAQGVPADSIQITPLESREDFFCVLAGAGEGARNVYFFGHGSPLTMWIGDESVKIPDHVGTLQEEQVRLVAHYGCDFVDLDPQDVAPVQRQLKPGTHITLVGHRLPSDPYDDRWADPSNPLARVRLTPDRATMHFRGDELQDRVVPAIGALLGAPQSGLIPAAVSATARWQAGELYGRPPVSAGTEQKRRQAASAAGMIGIMGLGPTAGLLPAVSGAAASQLAPGATPVLQPPDDDWDDTDPLFWLEKGAPDKGR